jgi:hypothetical protein
MHFKNPNSDDPKINIVPITEEYQVKPMLVRIFRNCIPGRYLQIIDDEDKLAWMTNRADDEVWGDKWMDIMGEFSSVAVFLAIVNGVISSTNQDHPDYKVRNDVCYSFLKDLKTRHMFIAGHYEKLIDLFGKTDCEGPIFESLITSGPNVMDLFLEVTETVRALDDAMTYRPSVVN